MLKVGAAASAVNAVAVERTRYFKCTAKFSEKLDFELFL